MTFAQFWLGSGIIVAFIDLLAYKYWKYEKCTPPKIVCIFIYVMVCYPILIVEFLYKILTRR